LTTRGAALLLAAGLLHAAPLAAQDGPESACAAALADAAFCRTVAQGAEALLPALVIAAEGGNPVPGTASTLGMRLTSMPRWTVGGRLTLAQGTAPDLGERGGDNPVQVIPAAFSVDGSVGVLPGWSPLPTVGGVGSVDLLFGATVVPLLSSDGYGGSGGWGFAAGARAGLLRESFTLPGVSVSAMYRVQRDIRLGDDELGTTDSYIRGDLGVISVRAAASKSIFLLNLTAGVGWDRMQGDIELGYASFAGPIRLTAEDARIDRVTIFGEMSYTLMVLNFVLSAGWQQGPEELEDGVGTGYEAEGAPYASAVLRLSV
jgi:hypothetical protein